MATCTTCNAEMKLIPAGISKKTGRAYTAFYSCPNRCPKSGAPVAPQPDPIRAAQDRKSESINGAMDRKEEAVRIEGSKSGAGRIVSAMISVGVLDSNAWQEKYREIANWIYNFEPAPFK